MNDVKEKKGYHKTKIGWMPNDWEVLKIQDLIDNKCLLSHLDGNHGALYPKKSEFVNEGVPYVAANSFVNNRVDFSLCKRLTPERAKKFKKGIAKDGDVLFAHNATVGPVALLVTEYDYVILSTTATYFRFDNSRINSNYWSQYISSELFRRQYEKVMKQSTRSQVPITAQRKFYGIVPSLKEQQKIAKILSTWDISIELTQNLITKLKKRKKGMMQQLLTGKKRLSGFNGEWEIYQIGEIASQFSDKNKNDDDIEVLSCTKYDGLVRSLDYFGRKVYGDDLTKYKVVPKNYFAYATNHIEEGSIGYQNIMPNGLVSPMYTVFKTNDLVDDSFLFRLLKTDRMIYQYQSNMSGSIARRGGLRWNVFETISIKIPSTDEQIAIAKLFDVVDEEMSVQESYLESLQSQKKGLMQQLLTGQKRVKT